MAHNARIRASGQWIAVSVIDPDELETFDLRQFEAINGDLGGTWAPADTIVIGGDGLTVSGPFTANSGTLVAMTSSGFIEFADAGVVTQAIGLGEYRLLECESNAQVILKSGANLDARNGSTITVKSGANVTAESGGVCTFASGSSLVIASGAIAGSAATWTQTGKFLRSGALARTEVTGRHLTVTNANATAGVEYDVITVDVTNASPAVLTLKVSTAPVPSVGEVIKVRKTGAGAGGLSVKNEGSAANIVTWSGSNTGSAFVWFDGTYWRLAGESIGGTSGADAG